MITDNNNNWHYLTVKSIFKLLRGITNNNGDSHCLNYFHSYRTKNKIKKHKKVCKDCDFCAIIMPDESKKNLKYNYGEQSLKVPFIIYADFPLTDKEK